MCGPHKIMHDEIKLFTGARNMEENGECIFSVDFAGAKAQKL